MTTYYVATLACYALVDADGEDEAKRLAMPALQELYADLRGEPGYNEPLNIRTVRPATDDEIRLQRFHDDRVARDRVARDQ